MGFLTGAKYMSTLETKTVSAACAGRMLGLGKAKTLQLVHSGRLPAKQLDGRIRVRLSDIEVFLKSLPDAAVRQ
jgi:excisionase family DNA binding protein